MLQEALLSLAAGGKRNLFTSDGELKFPTSCHPGEREVLTQIFQVAQNYGELKNFIAKHRLWTDDVCEDGCLSPGMYLCAFCDGMEQLFQPYLREIIKLEEDALADPQFVLSSVWIRVKEYDTLFCSLLSLIHEIEVMKINGTRLLTFLNRKSLSNVGQLQKALKHIISCCHVVLFKQLAEWLLHGDVFDPHSEFFITKSSESAVQNLESTSDSALTSSEYSCALDCPDFSKFEILLDMLPCYIPAPVANKVLFVGQVIRMFDTDPKTKLCQLDAQDRSSVWAGREIEFLKRLKEQQDLNKFDPAEFEKVVDDLRSCVTTHLWHLAVEEANMFFELKLVKDFFLLGRGELFHEFIQLAANILQKPPTNATKRDLNSAFQISVRKVLMNDEMPTEKFSFSFLPGHQDTGWEGLTLNYKVSWPLHLLFTKQALQSYNEMFNFLLRIRKVQMQLHDVWVTHTKIKSENLSKCRLLSWELRKNLSFVIDNLQYYLQVDVLESHYTVLQNALRDTEDFEMVQKHHTTFLVSILSHAFLLTKKKGDGSSGPGLTEQQSHPMHKALMKLLYLCEDFCYLMSAMWEPELEPSIESELVKLKQEYDKILSLLLRTLSSIEAPPYGSYLRQLLLHLDYNSWFTQHRTC